MRFTHSVANGRDAAHICRGCGFRAGRSARALFRAHDCDKVLEQKARRLRSQVREGTA